MSCITEKAVELVKEHVLDALRDAPMSTSEIQDGFFQRWRRELLDGKLHLGSSQVGRALKELERRGVVRSFRESKERRAQGRPGFAWELATGKRKVLPTPKRRERELILSALRGRGYVSSDAVFKASGLTERVFLDSIASLVQRGVVEEIRVECVRTSYRAFRLRVRN